MWPSFEAASLVSVLANFALICSLVVGVIATVAIVWSGNVKEAYLDQDRRQSQERVAGLDVAVSEANARAAEANEKAEAERLTRVRIEERISGRHLSPPQRQLIVEKLKATGKRYVTVRVPPDDPERVAFANDLVSTFKTAGWVAHVETHWPPYAFWATGIAGLELRSTGNGVEAFPASAETADIVSKAFSDAGWPVTRATNKDPGLYGAGRVKEADAPDKALLKAVESEVEIVVGPRAP